MLNQHYLTQSLKDSVDVLDDYDAIILGSPTYMGSVAAGLKEFMEKSSRKWSEQKWKNKIAAGFTNSHSLSGDKLNSLIQLVVFAAQHGMIWVGQAEHNQSPEGFAGKEDVVNRIGSYLSVMAQSENDTPDVTPPSGDKLTAYKFGQRIAEITKAFSF
ncbi:flavodoxin family protein [Francisella tularensis]|uniref:flavodoxin family protein n=1 Tax=Francisella tularensis TaxID=263 RepID=UPI001F352AFC|nr:flavodoxin family protein [Francisella tularensis]MDN9004031.1 flavodoxin family protein [Francisella tularensis subsp. mediasiatica]MDN9008252.1 flavodoxin family protein [Francisella tularensis subsp. mediasiatica]WKL70028.1 flavodoxin family protein [Francisella tularensis subsp. mediasiatica]WKL72462.1 flavodoxin family protein [Francisella tularensis subsp. mediasiatica]WKL73501.1 flavodoxin family protein [Francisella tularensis subsp. mediasiatica]